ncbi:hypothetical protein HpBT318_04620 [Helicobacter pylori]
MKDKIHHNALSDDELDRIIAFRGQEFEKNLEDLMPSSLGVHSYDEGLNLAKKDCVKNFKGALKDFAEKIKESPNDLNAMSEAFNNLETELERITENLSQKTAPILERYENDKQQALGYGEFLKKEKEGFIVDEQNPYPEEVRFNELRLAEFESVFSVIVPLEDLDKPACAHHALKALEAVLKNRDLGFDATELEQIAKGFIPRGYLWHFDANVLGNLALVKEELLLGVKHTKRILAMETIPTNSELNWEFVEPLNEKALSGLEDQLKMGLSDAFKDFVKRSNYGFSQWRSFMVGNKSYTFKHVLNFNLEGKGLLIDFMQSLKEWLEPEEIIFANDGYGGYYLLNTASDVVLFLDTDDGSKHALLHIKMFLIKRELKDLQKDEKFWTESSHFKVSVPVGWDVNHKEVCFEIGGAQNHTLICGRSGSGKSNFLHVLIQNLAFYYAPNEIQLFLLDYKEGVEFNAYAKEGILEHARLVSVASSVGFGVSFLSWLDKETKKRGELFK